MAGRMGGEKVKVLNLGVQIVKDAAIQASDSAGDGTTTTTVLTQSMFSKGVHALTLGSSFGR